MKCFHCQGELKRGTSTYTLNRRGYHVIIDDVPAWVCTQCGEPLFEEKQVNAIQSLVQELDKDMPAVLQPA